MSLERWFQRSKWLLIWHVHSELKTRKKLREKEEAKKKKDAEKAAKQPPAAKAKVAEAELDPTQYTNNRKQFIQ